MRTTVALDKISQLIEGRHENPFELLGPHEVDRRRPPGLGGSGVSARHRRRPGSSTRPHAEPQRPMRRIHPAGLFEAICPASEFNGSGRYLLRVADEGGKKSVMHDPYAFPHLLTDYDLHLLNEGTPLADATSKLGAQLRTIDGVDGRELRRLGAQRHERQRRRRLQRLGRPPPPDAQAHPQRLLGTVHPGPGRGHALQVPHPAPRPRLREVRSLRLRRRGAAAHRRRSSPT